jgi:Ca2+/Na+ antiporter
LGAFSLGLLFHSSNDAIEFDNSAKIYSALSLALTTFATFVVYFAQAGLWKAFGGILIALFVVYIGSVVWAISKGRMKAPELSDDEDSDESDGEGAIVREAAAATSAWAEEDGEETPLLNGDPDPPAEDSRAPEQQPEPESGIVSQHAHHGHSLLYHVGFLVLGFVCLTLASYVLSHSASSLTTALGISDVLFGVIILSIATTLPEKFVAVLAGHRGHRGILVANTVGSNMFLLSLCLGIVMLHTGGEFDERKGRGNVNVVELGVLWVSSLTFAATVWLGTGKWSKWIGSVMLGCYVVFLVLEFVIVRSVIAT